MNKTKIEGIETIIFDLGGVILDIDREKAVERFKAIGLSQADDLLDSYKQQGIFLQLEEGKLSRHEYYDELRKLAGAEMSGEQIDYAWMGFFPPVIQGRLDFVNELRGEYRICLLSNTNPIAMEGALSPRFSP